MTFKSGFGSNAKQVIYRLAPQEGEASLYSLTPRQVKALLSNTDYLSWPNRHSALPEDIDDKDKLEAWVSKLNLDLMTPIEAEMDCDAIEACIIAKLGDPDSALYNAMKDRIKDDPSFLEDLAKALAPFPEGELSAASSYLPELWAQCVEIVDFTDKRIRNMFADLEVQFNNVEIATFTEALPFIGTLIDEAQLDVALDLVNYAQEIWLEQYDANYTEDPPPDLGTKYIMACKLFCLCEADGVITIERVVTAFSSLVVGHTINLDSIGEIIQTIIGVNDNNEQVVYLTFTVVWGIARIASYLGGKRISHTILNALIQLAKNDANDDYLIYCEDCAEEEEICDNALIGWLFTTEAQGFTEIVAGYGIHDAGYGWGVGSYGFVIGIEKEFNEPIVRIKIFMKKNESATVFIRDMYAEGWASYSYTTLSYGEVEGMWCYELLPDTPIPNGISIQFFTTDTDQYIQKICLFDTESD